jgi:hypothetical protein
LPGSGWSTRVGSTGNENPLHKRWKDRFPASAETARITGLLQQIAVCELEGITLPTLPKRLQSKTRSQIDAKGGLLSWARSQKKYNDIIDKHKAKITKITSNTLTTPDSLEINTAPLALRFSDKIGALQAELKQRQAVLMKAEADVVYLKQAIQLIMNEIDRLRSGR